MSEPFVLSLDECLRLKERLTKAVANNMSAELLDIIDVLTVSDIKLKNISESGLGLTVRKLCKSSDEDVASAADKLKREWQAKVDTNRKSTAAGPANPPVKAEKPEERKISPTGDQLRDTIRDKLQEAFKKGKADNERLCSHKTDTALMAEEVETAMYEVYDGSATKQYKARSRTLISNLQDAKNPDFIRAVVTGQIRTSELATMEVCKMASEEMKMDRRVAAYHAMKAKMAKPFEPRASPWWSDDVVGTSVYSREDACFQKNLRKSMD